MQRNASNAMNALSDKCRGWNLSHDMDCVKLEACSGPLLV